MEWNRNWKKPRVNDTYLIRIRSPIKGDKEKTLSIFTHHSIQYVKQLLKEIVENDPEIKRSYLIQNDNLNDKKSCYIFKRDIDVKNCYCDKTSFSFKSLQSAQYIVEKLKKYLHNQTICNIEVVLTLDGILEKERKQND